MSIDLCWPSFAGSNYPSPVDAVKSLCCDKLKTEEVSFRVSSDQLYSKNEDALLVKRGTERLLRTAACSPALSLHLMELAQSFLGAVRVSDK